MKPDPVFDQPRHGQSDFNTYGKQKYSTLGGHRVLEMCAAE
jgi:hypothetical protein